RWLERRAGANRRGHECRIEIGTGGDDERVVIERDPASLLRTSGLEGSRHEANGPNGRVRNGLPRELIGGKSQRTSCNAAAAWLLSRMRRIENRHARTGSRERPRSARTRRAGADDRDVAHVIHYRASSTRNTVLAAVVRMSASFELRAARILWSKPIPGFSPSPFFKTRRGR